MTLLQVLLLRLRPKRACRLPVRLVHAVVLSQQSAWLARKVSQEYCISNPDTIGCDSPPAEPIAAIPEEVTTAGAPDDASTPASPADDAANATNTTTAPVSGGRRLLRAW